LILRDEFVRTGQIVADDQSGHVLFYEDYGPKEAPPFIVVHGNGGSLCDIHRLPMFALKTQRVIQLHARGVGQSLPSGATHVNQYPDWVRDIEQLRRTLALEKVTLCGWSGGTAVALMYAQMYPQRCAGLILCGTWLASKEEISTYYERVAQRYPEGWRELLSRFGTDDPVKALNLAVTTASNAEDRLLATAHYEMIFENGQTPFSELIARHDAAQWRKIEAGRVVYANMMLNNSGLAAGQVEQGMSRLVGVPVLYMNGGNDHITPPTVAARLCAQTNRALHFIVPGAGHDIHDSKMQQALTGLLRAFPANIVAVKPAPSSPAPR
jgi:proline iminopeptidase